MKIIFLLIIMVLIITGCSSEFYTHDSLYKDWDHMEFSWWGYKNPTPEYARMSEERGWWGEEIPYIPAE